MRKAVADIAKLALLDILLDGVQCFFLGYLEGSYQINAFDNIVTA